MRVLQKRKMDRLVCSIRKSWNCHLLKNSCSETVMDLHTRKSDKRNHGFGLSSVKQIVEKYNGDVWWESEKESFTLNINLWEKIEK